MATNNTKVTTNFSHDSITFTFYCLISRGMFHILSSFTRKFDVEHQFEEEFPNMKYLFMASVPRLGKVGLKTQENHKKNISDVQRESPVS